MNKRHIIQALAKGEREQSKLPTDILGGVAGFSPPKIRHFLNNLCDFSDCNYFEVGVFQGSTLLSAAYKNPGRYCGIDDFSEFNNTRQNLDVNLKRFAPSCNITFHEGDCWEYNQRMLPSDINVFLYDGSHDLENQRRGITHFMPKLADRFVLMVDDYSWEESIKGTDLALEELGIKVDLRLEIHDKDNNDGWWNGFLILLASKD
jgi:hypothetical protein